MSVFTYIDMHRERFLNPHYVDLAGVGGGSCGGVGAGGGGAGGDSGEGSAGPESPRQHRNRPHPPLTVTELLAPATDARRLVLWNRHFLADTDASLWLQQTGLFSGSGADGDLDFGTGVENADSELGAGRVLTIPSAATQLFTKSLDVKPQRAERQAVTVAEDCKLWWTFRTASPAHTLHFRIEGADQPKGEEAMLERMSYECLETAEVGCLEVAAGTYTFVWDNNESLLKVAGRQRQQQGVVRACGWRNVGRCLCFVGLTCACGVCACACSRVVCPQTKPLSYSIHSEST
jgi:hypothetical protein